MRVLTTKDIKNNILSIYKIGDTLCLKKQNESGGYSDAQFEIVDFYDNYVLCQSDGANECFQYWDLLNKSKKTKRQKARSQSGHVGISWHNANNRWVVNLRLDGATKYIGSYSELLDAIEAKDAVIKEAYNLYRCDPKKNIECCKKGCSHIHGRGSCEYTAHEEFSLSN